MNTRTRARASPHWVEFVFALGLLGLVVAHAPAVARRLLRSVVGPIEGVTFNGSPPPGSTWIEGWFYVIAWWSYIVVANAYLFRRERPALLFDRPRAFFLLALHSASFWFAFELVNLRLANWYYVGMPPDLVSRGPGMFLAFATVLPGVFVTRDLVTRTGLFESLRGPRLSCSPQQLRWLSIAGWLFLILPLVFPRYAFPLIWGALVLIAEPWLFARGERCLLRFVHEGRWTQIARLLLAGAAAGLLWESWNSIAGSSWVYTVPFFENTKLFEMPLAGFLGFPPFALECYTFARLAVALGWVPEWELDIESAPRRPTRVAAGVALSIALSLPAVILTNLMTVRSTQPRVSELSGITEETLAFLEDRNIGMVDHLHRAFYNSDFRMVGTQPGDRMRWLDEGHLMQVKRMGLRGARWLQAVGIERRSQLAEQDAGELIARLAEVDGPAPRPSPAEVRIWVRAAQPDANAPCCSADERLRYLHERYTLRQALRSAHARDRFVDSELNDFLGRFLHHPDGQPPAITETIREAESHVDWRLQAYLQLRDEWAQSSAGEKGLEEPAPR